MRPVIESYRQLFFKTLDLPGICWWIIDYEDDPEHFYCNDFMVETFDLDPILAKYSVAQTCPIAGDYNKNIEMASQDGVIAAKIFEDYMMLVEQKIPQYANIFPYFNEKSNKTMYFSSRALVLEKTAEGRVSVIYGIIEDITRSEEQKKELEAVNGELARLYVTDYLTQLYNRRKLDEILEQEANRYERTRRPFSVILMDLDHFKEVNDTYGHQKGDVVLCEMAALLRQHIRKIDTIGRWGGEEFLIICPDTNLAEVAKVAEKLRITISKYRFVSGIHKTASFGVSEFREKDTPHLLISRADYALYEAKEEGRNRVRKS